MAETAMKTQPDEELGLKRSPHDSDLKEWLHEHYTVGWVCALPKEQTAAMAMLDHRHPDLPKPLTDSNAYTLGSIGKHMIVIACLPKGQIGNNSAATVATRMVSTFPAVRACFMVGIGGGVPSKVRLGDVVVSTPTGQYPGVVQWDFGKAVEGGRFERTGALNNPPGFILTALAKLESVHEMEGSKITEFLEDLRQKWPRLAPKYLRSDSFEDVLFKAEYEHVEGNASDGTDDDEEDESCRLCDRTQTRKRKPRDMRIHYGLIASGNQVVKDGTLRDNLNRNLGGKVLCIEMEAAGLTTSFPCLVIRGICDYADSHKNIRWQEHAAAVAAAFTKEFLGYIEPQEVEEQRAARETLRELRKAVAATELNTERLRHHIQCEEDNKVLEWLAPFDYGPQQSDLLSKCHPGTGQWLFQSSEFSNWEHSSSGTTLLCTGIPGAGKTMITSLVIDHLHTRFCETPDVGVGYIYCNFRRHYQQQYADILASLLKQLCQTQPALPDAAKTLYNRHGKQTTRPSLAELSEALQAVMQMYSQTFIIVDALDECQSLGGTRSAVLSHLFRIQNDAVAHLFFTSRHVPDVLQHFGDCERLEVRAMDQDVRSYVDGHLPQILEAVPETPGLLEEIREKILGLADGMFLLAYLYLESLRDKTSATELRAVIGTAYHRHDNNSKGDERQQTLYQAYDEAMTRIAEQSPGFRDLGTRILAWIVHAERPLSTMELQHALAIRENDTHLDLDNLRKMEVILSVCAGLVTVDQESDVIRLIHFTTQEYFDADGTRTKYFPDAQAKIAAACASYLSLNALRHLDGLRSYGRNFRAMMKLLPLLRYAACTWGHHARKGSFISPAVFKFLAIEENVRVSSELIRFPPRTLHTYQPKYPKLWTALHLAAFFDLQEVTQALIKGGRQPDLDDSSISTPLLIASCKGHETIVRLLLEGGVQVDDGRDYWGRTPLSIASESGHEEIMKLLLGAGAGIDARDNGGVSPLHAACRVGSVGPCMLLIERGANIDARDENGRTPLHSASLWGHQAICQLLLDMGADLEARDYSSMTPSHMGGCRGHRTIGTLKRLSESDTDVSSTDGWTPLWLALGRKSNMAAVEVLIKRGAKFDLEDGLGQTPLTHALHLGNDAGVRLLLGMGASIDVSSRDSKGRSPLCFVTSSKLIEERSWAFTEFHEIPEATEEDFATIATLLIGLVHRTHRWGPACTLCYFAAVPF